MGHASEFGYGTNFLGWLMALPVTFSTLLSAVRQTCYLILQLLPRSYFPILVPLLISTEKCFKAARIYSGVWHTFVRLRVCVCECVWIRWCSSGVSQLRCCNLFCMRHTKRLRLWCIDSNFSIRQLGSENWQNTIRHLNVACGRCGGFVYWFTYLLNRRLQGVGWRRVYVILKWND